MGWNDLGFSGDGSNKMLSVRESVESVGSARPVPRSPLPNLEVELTNFELCAPPLRGPGAPYPRLWADAVGEIAA